MTRKLWLFVAFAVVLGGVSLYLNKDWFGKDDIRIFHRSRPARASLSRSSKRPDPSLVNPVTFGFNRRLQLTCVKVVPMSAVETNKYPQPLWHLVTSSNSVPVNEFMYGEYIRGMRPAVKGATPDPLEPGVKYRLYVEAGEFKGQHEFVPVPKTP